MRSASIQELRQRFQKGDASVRRQVVEELIDFGSLGYELLVEALQDPGKGVRDAACFAFSQFPCESAARAVAPLLAHEDIEVRNLASEILAGYKEEAVETLLEMLVNPDPDVRKFCVDILGLSGSGKAIASLTHCLDDEDENVAVSAAEALGNLRAAEATEALIAHFDRFEGMQPVVVDALGKMQSAAAERFLLRKLDGDNETLQLIALSALAESSNPDCARNIATKLPHFSAALRHETIKAIYHICRNGDAQPEQFFEAALYADEILELLFEADARTSEYILQSLPDSFVSAHIEAILELLADRGGHIGEQLYARLKKMPADFLEHVLQPRLPDCSPETQIAILGIFAERELTPALSLLETLARSEIPDVRMVVAQYLGLNEDAATLPLLFKLTGDGDETVAEAAYMAMSNRNAEEAVTVFKQGLKHENESIRETSMYGLANNSPQALSEAVADLLNSGNPEDIALALQMAQQFIGIANYADVTELLKHEQPRIRALAARAMAAFKVDDAFEEVQLLLSDIDREVRLAALESLLEISPGNAETAIAAALDDADFWIQVRAIEAATENQMTAIAPKILSLALSSNHMVQTKAIVAVLKLAGKEGKQELCNLLHMHGMNADALIESSASEFDELF